MILIRRCTVILFLIILISTCGINAQIENEIKSYVDSTEIMINNGRRLLLQKIQEKEYGKAAEIFNYLKDKSSMNKCQAFSFNEELYISCLISDWANFLNRAEQFGQVQDEKNCYPDKFKINELLYKEVAANADKLLENARKDELSQEDDALLDMYFYLLSKGSRDEIYDRKINSFKKQFSQSRYANFVKNYLPEPEVRAGLTYAMGATEIFPTGNMKQYFDAGTAFSFSMDFCLNKLYLSLFFNVGNLNIKKSFTPITSDYIYHFYPEDKFSYFDGGLACGYLLRGKYVHFSPFLSIGGSTLESMLFKDPDDDDKEFKIYDSFIFGPGIHTEFKLHEFKINNTNYYGSPFGYLSLRLDGGYNIITSTKYDPAKGNSFYAKATLVFGIGKF
jgi:hypothetical protein